VFVDQFVGRPANHGRRIATMGRNSDIRGMRNAMRRIVLTLTMLTAGLAQTGWLQAGVYNLDPPPKYPSDYIMTNQPQPWWRVKDYILELRSIHDLGIDPKKPPGADSLRANYEKHLAQLEARKQEGVLNIVDRVNMSGCLIRLGRYGKAEQVLEESLRLASPDDPFRFLLLLHRSALYQELGEENDELQQRALRFQEEGIQSWPALLPGWNRWESDWYRRAELYTKTLMELRHHDLISRQPIPARQMPAFDLLFPQDTRDPAKKVRFLGASGKYEPCGIARDQMDRLPRDAVSIGLQLLLWRPRDTRRIWLYGELLNAWGNVDMAFDMLDYAKKNGWQNVELDSHHRTLQKALGAFELLFLDKNVSGENQRLQASIFWALAPRGSLLSPGLGTAASELGGWTSSTYAGRLKDTDFPSSSPPGKGGTTLSSPLPDWRQLTVSFLAGILVAVLGMLQWQQWRRQRRLGTSERASAAAHFTSSSDIAEPSRYSRPTDG
jgi:hypothetical protein